MVDIRAFLVYICILKLKLKQKVMDEDKKRFAEFAKYIHDHYTDKYGHLQISDESDGEFILASFEQVAEEFLTKPLS